MSRLDNITLNPLSAGDIIDRAARLYKQNILVLLRISLIPTLISFTGLVLFSFAVRNSSLDRGDERIILTLALFVLGGGLWALGGVLFYAFIGGASRSIIYHFYDGTPINARDCLRSVKSRFFSLLGATIIVAFFTISFAFIILIVALFTLSLYVGIIGVYISTAGWIPGIIQAIIHFIFIVGICGITILAFLAVISRTIFVPQVMMVESKKVGASISRSFNLATGEVKRIGAVILFWIYVLVSIWVLLMTPVHLIGWWIGLDLGFFFDTGPPLWVVIARQITMQAAIILIMPVIFLGFTLMYVDVRVRKEGFDVELLANLTLPPPTSSSPSEQSGKKAKSEPIQSVIKFSCIAGLLLLSFTEARASDSVDGYIERLELAEQILDELIEKDDVSSEEALTTITTIKQLLPQTEILEINGQTFQVDNSDIYKDLDSIVKKIEATSDANIYALSELSARLANILDKIRSGSKASSNNDSGNIALAAGKILKRQEYNQGNEVKDSRIKQYLKDQWDKFVQAFKKNEPKNEIRNVGQIGSLTVWIIRIVILILLAVVVGFGLQWLLRKRESSRRFAEEETLQRTEILGEVIPDDVDSSDLYASAMEAAKSGNFRLAVRRAYIASLLDMSDKGILRLQKSKTNRDYLKDLKTNSDIYPRFYDITRTYELVWYGQRQCTMSEFETLLSLRNLNAK